MGGANHNPDAAQSSVSFCTTAAFTSMRKVSLLPLCLQRLSFVCDPLLCVGRLINLHLVYEIFLLQSGTLNQGCNCSLYATSPTIQHLVRRAHRATASVKTSRTTPHGSTSSRLCSFELSHHTILCALVRHMSYACVGVARRRALNANANSRVGLSFPSLNVIPVVGVITLRGPVFFRNLSRPFSLCVVGTIR